MTPNADDIMAVHLATGGGVLEVKLFLGDASPLLCERVIAAARQSDGDHTGLPSITLEDPLITDPKFGQIIQRIQDEESCRIKSENDEEWPIGSCHRIWKRMKDRLSDEHEIEWFSPADLHPFTAYD